MKGTDFEAFPKLKLPRPPEEVAKDPEVRRTILAYWRGADELRVEMPRTSPTSVAAGPPQRNPTGDVARPEERADGGRDVRDPNR